MEKIRENNLATDREVEKVLIQKTDVVLNASKLFPKTKNHVCVKSQKKLEKPNYHQRAANYVDVMDAILEIIKITNILVSLIPIIRK